MVVVAMDLSILKNQENTGAMKILVTSDESMFGDNFHFSQKKIFLQKNFIDKDIMETKFAFLTISLSILLNSKTSKGYFGFFLDNSK